MAFRSPVRRISQLIADKFSTGDPGTTHWEISSSAGIANQILGYTGAAAELQPGYVQVVKRTIGALVGGTLEFLAPQFSGPTGGALNLGSWNDGTTWAEMHSGGSNSALIQVLHDNLGDSSVKIEAQTITLMGTANALTGATGQTFKTASVNVPLLAAQINSAAVVYTFPVAFSGVPTVQVNSVVNSVLAARVLAVTAANVTLQSYWSDQGAGHSAVPTLPVHVTAIGPI